MPELDNTARTELEAAAFRRLVSHLRERTDVQQRIATLNNERSAWVSQQNPTASTLGDGLKVAVQAQATAAGFTIAP